MSSIVFGLIYLSVGSTQLTINLDVLARVESQIRQMAFNRHTCARGVFQITPIVLEEWNRTHPEAKFKPDDLFEVKVNSEIARWYLSQRIPQLLDYYSKPLTIQNVLICWNAGIRYVIQNDKLPNETIHFIEKYINHANKIQKAPRN